MVFFILSEVHPSKVVLLLITIEMLFVFQKLRRMERRFFTYSFQDLIVHLLFALVKGLEDKLFHVILKGVSDLKEKYENRRG